MNILFPALTILASIAFTGLLGYFNKTKGKSISFSPVTLFFWTIALASLMSWGFLQLMQATVRGQQGLIRFSPLFRDGLPITFLALGLVGLIWARRIGQRVILSLGVAIFVCVSALIFIGDTGQGDLLTLPAGIRTLNGWMDVLGFIIILVGAVLCVRGYLWNGGSSQKAIAGACIFTAGIALAILKSMAGINIASPFIAVLAIIAATWFVFQSAPAVTDISVNIDRRRSRVRLYGIGFGVFSILTAVALLPFMPVYMGISDAKFKSVYINRVPDENNGVYVIADKGVMQLYGWSIEPDDFPSDSPVLDLTTVHQFTIVSKQFDVPDAYQLYNGTTGQQVKWQAISQKGVELTLTPASLDPGEYEFVTPTDSMFGGDTYEYFTLR